LSQKPSASYVVDANVLIDYCDSDLRMLSLFSQHIGTTYIARSTFEKVNQLTVAAARRHNLRIETPDPEIIMAASARRGSLAYDDHETLMLAKRHGWICITNDKPLRRECETEGVVCLWGLEPMKALVEHGIVSVSKVLTVAKMIQSVNPGFISDTIMDRFEEQVREIQEGLKRSDGDHYGA